MKSNRTLLTILYVLIGVIIVLICILIFRNNSYNKLLEAEQERKDSIEMANEAKVKMIADSIAKVRSDSVAKAKADSIAMANEKQNQAEQLALIRKVMKNQPRGNALKQYCTSNFWASGEPVSFNDNAPGLYFDYDMIDVHPKSITAIGNNRVKVILTSEELRKPISVIYSLEKENGSWKISGMK